MTAEDITTAVAAALRETRMRLNGSIDAELTIPEAFGRIHDTLVDHGAKLESLGGVIAEETRRREAALALRRILSFVRNTSLGRIVLLAAKIIGLMGAGGAIWKFIIEKVT